MAQEAPARPQVREGLALQQGREAPAHPLVRQDLLVHLALQLKGMELRSRQLEQLQQPEQQLQQLEEELD